MTIKYQVLKHLTLDQGPLVFLAFTCVSEILDPSVVIPQILILAKLCKFKTQLSHQKF